MDPQVLEQRIKQLEKEQEKFVLKEVFDIFKDELKDIRGIADQNKYTIMKIIGGLIVFNLAYTPIVANWLM